MHSTIKTIFVLSAFLQYAKAAHSVASHRVLGIVSESGVNRDSCGSVRIYNSALWVCRDSQPIVNGVPGLPVTANTAAWTNFNSDGTPQLNQYGDASRIFYPFQADECGSYGVCSDGTRWVGWPDTPPLVTVAFPNGDTGAYTWVNRQHLKGLALANDSINYEVSLYYVEYQPERDGTNLPQVTLVDEGFWSANDAPYGSYGSINNADTVYLYGKRADNTVALAKVPAASVRDKSQYQYYVNGQWTSTKPGRNDSTATIPNAGAGGQGTFYFSSHWNEYVWIGGTPFPGATFFMTTAPAPEGPWDQPYQILDLPGGTAPLPAYSLQAHPGLTTGTGKDMYLTFTNVTDVYSTPLIYVAWDS